MSPAAATRAVATNAPPMVEVMVASLLEVTKEIFSTMLDRKIEFSEPTYAGPQPTAHVVATVGYAGSLSGYVSLCVSKDAALEIAQALLGSSADDAHEHVRDAAGEMANMIAGSVRTQMTEKGENLGISTPIVTVGTDFTTAALRDVSQAVCPFRMGVHDNLFVYLVLQGKGRR